jgi:tRNA/rRNA methyltransferase
MPTHELANIRIVLVEPSHPGNIGATARAMKTMGLSNLTLVQPRSFPAAEASARAAGADNVLFNASVVDNLDAALEGCLYACATTARRRELSVPPTTPRAAAPELIERAKTGIVAIVFGRESSGLSNAELSRCQTALEVPSNPEFASLNLASAVQLVSYELRLASLDETPPASAREAVSVPQLEGLYRHFEVALTEIGYLDPNNPKKLLQRLRALFGRADLSLSELQVLRGILTAAQAHNMDARIRREQRDSKRGANTS